VNEQSYNFEDPIAALATPWGASALAVIRTSGRGTVELLSRFFSRGEALRRAEGYSVVRGTLLDGEDGEPVDDIVVAVFRAPFSYTGEESAELYIHGSLPGIQRILEILGRKGFRMANPGEFTLRAFLNGKLDLTRAEAVNEIVQAKSDQAHLLALHRLAGSIENRILELRDELLMIMGEVELQLDYSEDEGEAEEREPPLEGLRSIRMKCLSLADTYKTGRLFQEGVRVALGGRTNAGKSSLFNLFLKEDRAIVSEVHGTTRDYIEGWINLEGLPVLLYDTAGLRIAADEVESEGVRRTEQVLTAADIVLYLVDSTVGINEEDEERMRELERNGIACLKIWNKTDLSGGEVPEEYIALSVVTLQGFGDVEKAVRNRALRDLSVKTEECVIDSLRQKELLDRAVRDLDLAGESIANDAPLDMIAVDLKDALDALGEIVGEVTSADILDAIFSNFCVGK
jgi:tRNA modification GTPase